MPVEELFKKPKKDKKGRRGQWPEHLTDDLVDIILVDSTLGLFRTDLECGS